MENAIVQTSQASEFITTENSSTQIETSRAVQEVQGMILVAQRCPRDEVKAHKKIMEAAKRKTLAENAIYAYPRGGQIIKGPSIRSAETLAKYWGNIDFGIKELSQDNHAHTSEVMAYAWDLETNTRQSKTFKVPHTRIARGNKVTLTDPRDIYELIANNGARRLRSCILGVLPSDIVEDFINECEKTLTGDSSKPLNERIRDMVEKFEQIGVSQEMIEKRLGCKADSIIIKQLVDLGAVYKSIKDNFKSIDDYFDTGKKEIKKGENVLELKQEEIKDGSNNAKTK